MSPLFESQEAKVFNEKLSKAVNSLYDITTKINHQELKQTVSDVRARINDPYMFVIVGEVKAGKSSFINALLDSKEEICKVAASPMTDTIQQITYGPEVKIEEINPYLKRIYQPIEILKEIAIVDTPGTNTIVDHHQEITEKFIPSSDLIVFVFESKNPYRQSAWEFFDYINEDWHKKIIFILQQKDLMQPDDLVTNTKGVYDQAVKKGIPNPNVFAVSAKQELENQKDISGFIQVRDYIKQNITGNRAPYLKIENNAQTALMINDKIYKGVLIRKEQYEADLRFRADIKKTLDQQELRTKRQIKSLVDNLLSSYDKITTEKEMELKDGLGFVSLVKRSFGSMFGGGSNAKQWLDGISSDLENKFNNSLKDKLQDGVIDIAESIQDMGKIVDAKIKNSETILKDDHEIFADIAERRANVLNDLQRTFSGFLKKSENFYDQSLLEDGANIAPNIATGGGIAAVGIILTVVTNGAVFDVTGGIITTLGLAFAGVTVGIKRGKIISGYKEAVKKGRDKIEQDVTEKLESYTAKIKDRIDLNFLNFDSLLEEEKNTINFLDSEFARINTELNEVEKDVQKHLN